MTRHSMLNELYPAPQVEIHEIDAEQINVQTGDIVRVTSRRGSIVAHVLVTPKARPGVVFLPMHFQEAAANLLTIDTLDALAKIPEFKACAVNITIANENNLATSEQPIIRGRY
jgi:anaerobic selenocysteine-containing dehydrogenase